MPATVRSAAIPALALALGVFALFATAARNDFVSLDDPAYVLENPHVRAGLTREGAVWAFTSFHSYNWHPVTWLSHMLDVSVFGLEPAGHHLVSAALHALNAALLLLALRALGGALWPSALAAALFAVHPLRVESVAWVAERKDLLAGLFWMLALLAYAAWVRRPGPGRYAALLLAAALGLASKPMGVTLPAVLLLLDAWPLRRREPLRRLVVEKLPLLALSAASAVVTLLAQHEGGAVRSLEVVPLGARLANALVACAVYLRRAVWPDDLAVFYPHPALVGRADELWLPAAGAAALLAGLSALAFRERRRRPWLGVGWLWFLITLAPVVGVVQVGAHALADRYSYLPMIGLAVATAWAAREGAARLALRPAACAALALAVLAALSAVTVRQIATWRDGETLFARALAVTQDNFFALTSLGAHYRATGRPERAEALLRRALAARPAYVRARVELGMARAEGGDLEGAAAELERALEGAPNHARAHNALGLVRLRQERLDEAGSHFERAVALDPGFAEAHNNLGLVHFRREEWEAARERFERALALRPDAEHPRHNLRAVLQRLRAP